MTGTVARHRIDSASTPLIASGPRSPTSVSTPLTGNIEDDGVKGVDAGPPGKGRECVKGLPRLQNIVPRPCRTGPIGRAVVEGYFESSCANPPKASTYLRMSSSVCWTEMVHCSSSPGVMKMPRFTIQVNDA